MQLSGAPIGIHAAARRSGLSDDEIQHAIRHALAVYELTSPGEPHRVLYLGPSSVGIVMKIVAIVMDDGSELAIHASAM